MSMVNREAVAGVHIDVPNVTPYYEGAAVVVAPIRMGSGTRLKVLEALAQGKAVVATTTAIEGIDVRPGIDLAVAAMPEAFATASARLLTDPAVRYSRGASGRARGLERYRWERIGATTNQVLEGVVS